MKPLIFLLTAFFYQSQCLALPGRCNSKKGKENHQKFCEAQKKPACDVQPLCVWETRSEKHRAAFVASMEADRATSLFKFIVAAP